MAGRPSYAQLARLIEYMEEHPQLAKGRMRCNVGRHETQLKWEELTNILNNIEGVEKSSKQWSRPRAPQWSRFWADKKYGLKRRQVAQRNAAAYRLRYGLDDEAPPLSSLDDRILSLLDGKKREQPKPPAAKRAVEQPKAGPSRARTTAARGRPIATRARSNAARARATATRPRSTAARARTARNTGAVLRRSTRIRVRNLRTLERRRLINIEEKRVQAETVQAIGWCKVAKAIKRMARAVVSCGEIIADAVMHRDIM
ncbi:hypothetical protein PYW07_000119 [Mythimna separata]|uniref:Regulatory protein zeste n=1 Tax=Mythimna separata TaxID=271217 RepID=A0AAD7Z120_MYTSE|nr:hypothetical protein PYW07_000119 [Mythimna separata]